MPNWLLVFQANNLLSTVGDMYACTPNVWTSISKFISFTLQDCWGSSHLNRYSGFLKGYVSIEDYRYVWFDHHHHAGPSDIEVKKFLEECALSHRNMSYLFYLPRTHRQIFHQYIDLKSLHVGRVPFMYIRGNGIATRAFSNECTLQTNSELFLVTADSKDLMFYCIQSQFISEENVVTTNVDSDMENSMVLGFPHHTFRCINLLELCNLSADQVQNQSRAMIEGEVAHNSVARSDELKLAIESAQMDQFEVEETCMLTKVKDEQSEDCQLHAMRETQQNPHGQQLEQHESPRHDNLLPLEGRWRPNFKEQKIMNYNKLLNISKTYGELAAANEYAKSKLIGALSSRVVPTLIMQCPGCGKFFPHFSPTALLDMLSHMRSKHKQYAGKLLLSISHLLDILIPYMQKKIVVWKKRERNRL